MPSSVVVTATVRSPCFAVTLAPGTGRPLNVTWPKWSAASRPIGCPAAIGTMSSQTAAFTTRSEDKRGRSRRFTSPDDDPQCLTELRLPTPKTPVPREPHRFGSWIGESRWELGIDTRSALVGGRSLDGIDHDVVARRLRRLEAESQLLEHDVCFGSRLHRRRRSIGSNRPAEQR